MELSPEMLDTLIAIGGAAVLGIITLIIGNWISKWLASLTEKFCQRSSIDTALTRFLKQIVRYITLVAVVIAALDRMGIETTSVLAIFASAGLAVGLALQGSLSNFASGVMILFFRPFKLGDFITAGGESGEVADIGLFASTLHTPDNRKIIIANSAITGGNITNFTALGTRRSTVEAGVAYGADIGQVMDILMKSALRADTVLSDPAPAVAFIDMAASSLNFAVHFWTAPEDWLDGMHNVRRAIYEDLTAAGVDIPYNQIVVHNAEA